MVCVVFIQVWSIVRRFDEPQKYKPFVQSCVMHGDVRPGNVREVYVISGLPASTSTEVLEILDDEQHILSYKVLGGDHRLSVRYFALNLGANFSLG